MAQAKQNQFSDDGCSYPTHYLLYNDDWSNVQMVTLSEWGRWTVNKSFDNIYSKWDESGEP